VDKIPKEIKQMAAILTKHVEKVDKKLAGGDNIEDKSQHISSKSDVPANKVK
jgi:hypothetical protein